MLPVLPHVYTTCPCNMSLLHVLAACSCCTTMLHVPAACPCCLSVLHVRDGCPCWMSMLDVRAACTCGICMQHVLVHAALFMLHVLAACLKGTHARDFHSLFLNFFLHISVTNRYKTQSSQYFRKYSSNLHRYSKFSITRCFRRKREAWLSVVAENAELNLTLSS